MEQPRALFMCLPTSERVTLVPAQARRVHLAILEGMLKSSQTPKVRGSSPMRWDINQRAFRMWGPQVRLGSQMSRLGSQVMTGRGEMV